MDYLVSFDEEDGWALLAASPCAAGTVTVLVDGSVGVQFDALDVRFPVAVMTDGVTPAGRLLVDHLIGAGASGGRPGSSWWAPSIVVAEGDAVLAGLGRAAQIGVLRQTTHPALDVLWSLEAAACAVVVRRVDPRLTIGTDSDARRAAALMGDRDQVDALRAAAGMWEHEVTARMAQLTRALADHPAVADQRQNLLSQVVRLGHDPEAVDDEFERLVQDLHERSLLGHTDVRYIDLGRLDIGLVTDPTVTLTVSQDAAYPTFEVTATLAVTRKGYPVQARVVVDHGGRPVVVGTGTLRIPAAPTIEPAGTPHQATARIVVPHTDILALADTPGAVRVELLQPSEDKEGGAPHTRPADDRSQGETLTLWAIEAARTGNKTQALAVLDHCEELWVALQEHKKAVDVRTLKRMLANPDSPELYLPEIISPDTINPTHTTNDHEDDDGGVDDGKR